MTPKLVGGRAALVATAVAALVACNQKEHKNASGVASAAEAAKLGAVHGDATRGAALMQKFECSRCHEAPGLAEASKDKQCVACHKNITLGRVEAPEAVVAKWRPKVEELGDVPSLTSSGSRLRRSFIAAFLLKPHDLRPALVPTMPRLAITPAEAADIATHLAPTDEDDPAADARALAGARPDVGRELLVAKGCGTCHQMSGAPPIHGSPIPVGVVVEDMPRALRLAPDLRYTRDRFRAKALVAWLEHPRDLKPDTPMPSIPLTADEAKHVAAYVLGAPLAPPAPRAAPARLPVLTRPVTYDEVSKRVFRKTCWHCHAEPDFERGDGGPGMSGGFGFAPRGLSLSEYAAIWAGALDEHGTRVSIFRPVSDGTPRLVAALLARQREEQSDGAEVSAEVRGMPLGLPALPPEEVQLVETWIAQGRKR